MISEQDKAKIIDIGRQYNVGEIFLFGSSIDPNRKAKDIDLAVGGIAPEEFFNFYGDLLFELSKPIDLIDLSSDTKFNRLVYRDGIRLYGQSA
jgi:predicted nucleotidyltransferase